MSPTPFTPQKQSECRPMIESPLKLVVGQAGEPRRAMQPVATPKRSIASEIETPVKLPEIVRS